MAETAMSGQAIERAIIREAILEKADDAAGADLGLLPKSVRQLVPSADGAEGLCEFEVVSGNAAFREGERFYLTPSKALKAYPAAAMR
jgi:hypothetical protein